MAQTIRITTHESDTVKMLAVAGIGRDRKKAVKKVSSSAGHPHYNRKGDPLNGPVNTTFTGSIRITALAGSDWFSVTTLDQTDKRTFYLAPDAQCIISADGVLVESTLSEYYRSLAVINKFFR